MVQRVIVVKSLTSQLLFVGAVAVAVIEILVVHQQFFAAADADACQVLVQVIPVPLVQRPPPFLMDGAVGVIGQL